MNLGPSWDSREMSASPCVQLLEAPALLGLWPHPAPWNPEAQHLPVSASTLTPTFQLSSSCLPLIRTPVTTFSSVTQLCLTLCDPTDCSTPGFPVSHQHPELTQTHVHPVSDAIQPSHPLSSPSPPAFNPSQHQGLFQWVSSSLMSLQSKGLSYPNLALFLMGLFAITRNSKIKRNSKNLLIVIKGGKET